MKCSWAPSAYIVLNHFYSGMCSDVDERLEHCRSVCVLLLQLFCIFDKVIICIVMSDAYVRKLLQFLKTMKRKISGNIIFVLPFFTCLLDWRQIKLLMRWINDLFIIIKFSLFHSVLCVERRSVTHFENGNKKIRRKEMEETLATNGMQQVRMRHIWVIYLFQVVELDFWAHFHARNNEQGQQKVQFCKVFGVDVMNLRWRLCMRNYRLKWWTQKSSDLQSILPWTLVGVREIWYRLDVERWMLLRHQFNRNNLWVSDFVIHFIITEHYHHFCIHQINHDFIEFWHLAWYFGATAGRKSGKFDVST